MLVHFYHSTGKKGREEGRVGGREEGREGRREGGREGGKEERGIEGEEWRERKEEGREGEMGGVSEGEVVVVSCPTHACFPVRNGLVNEVEFLGLYSPKVVRTNEIVRSVIIM